MIPIEQQVANLEPSEKLKEIGVVQESVFYWVERHQYPFEVQMHDLKQEPSSDDTLWKSYSAFTVAELLDGLPIGYVSVRKDCEDENMRYLCFEIESAKTMIYADTQANSLAKMRIHLIEKGVIDAK